MKRAVELTEAAVGRFVGDVAARWSALQIKPLIVGLRGELGAGKTTLVRALLRSLGYAGKVPSPTYTLVEHYEFEGLTVLHLDLYRLRSDVELEQIGLRDWLARRDAWLFAEWPECAPRFASRCDLMIDLEIVDVEHRSIVLTAHTDRGEQALEAIDDLISSKPS